jgi:pyridinium-3,5-bisthiocarboxylic acid mononucleotide nickel chelatase
VRIAYFDCIAGISGDMTLGALVDAGADFDELSERLHRLHIEPFEISREEVEQQGVRAIKVHVDAPAASVIRTYASIRSLLDQSDLEEDARQSAHRIFRRLAEAESRVHNKDLELVTFHEIGALDSIVDIVGVAIGLSLLGVERVFASPVPTGFGMHRTEHGMAPIPSPTVLELLRGVPMYSRGVPFELVTPTGAAILSAISEGYGDMPTLRIDGVGYGAGSHRLDFPNVLRIIVGDEEVGAARHEPARGTDELVVETNLGDLSPELSSYVVERVLQAGAREAWLTPVVVEGGRGGLALSVLCSPDRAETVREIVFAETGSRSIRTRTVQVESLERETVKVETPHGAVEVTIGRHRGHVVSVAPSFEDCARLARETGVAAKDVHAEALRLARETLA